jgi:ketosteroid isomerase-like protein
MRVKTMATDHRDTVKDLLAAVDSYDLDKYVTFFADDAEYKVGNTDPVVGPQGIREFVTFITPVIKTVTHEIKNIWGVGDTVICEVDVIYNRHDGKVFRVPNVNIIRFQGDKVHKFQAFIDASEVFA